MTFQRAFPTAALVMLLPVSTGIRLLAQNNPDAPPASPPAATTPVPAPAPAPAKPKAPAPRPDRPLPTGEAASEDGPAAQGLGPFGRVLPVGEKNIDVKIPSFKDGRPSSTVRAEVMTRMDAENMEMENMDIRLYGQTHDEDVRIRLLTANYHMPSQILSSETRSRVTRSDFDIQGDSMIFDTRTRQGTMTGNVRMVISDAGTLVSQKKEDEQAQAAGGDKPADKVSNPASDGAPAPPPAATAPPPTPPSTSPAK